MRELKPPKNFRPVFLKCCATCAYLEPLEDGFSRCSRPNGPELETQELEDWEHVCDRWRESILDDPPAIPPYDSQDTRYKDKTR